jgi:dTDP-4-dehydrorhamnose 3,5-epimerase
MSNNLHEHHQNQNPRRKTHRTQSIRRRTGLLHGNLEPKTFGEAGINTTFVQDNYSRSVKNTLRGLHSRIRQPQGKLMRVTRGEVFDVAVELRTNSPTFGQWVVDYLSEQNKRMLCLPPGFAHGFLVISEAEVYKASEGKLC